MTEAEWLADTTNLWRKAYFLRSTDGSRRRARLFACACCYRVWHFIQVEEARRIVGLAEAYADGEVTTEELEAADDPACFANLEERLHGEAEPQISALAYQVTLAAKWLAHPTFDMSAAGAVVEQIAVLPSQDFFRTPESGRKPIEIFPDEGELTKVWELLRDIVGNPFRPVTFDPAWRTEHTVGIATKMYDERNFDAMPILADALQDAGCENEEILKHCREPGVHVRGCWVVDLVLGKE